MKKVFFTTVIVLSLILVSSCSTTREKPDTRFTTYEDFYPGPPGGVDLVWTRADLRDQKLLRKEIAQYDNIMLERIEVVVGSSPLTDQEITHLVDYMSDQLKQEISSRKTFVEQPGENTLRLQIAISNVETPNPILATTSSILPVGLGISVISRITTGEHTNVGEATIELMLSDAVEGTPILAAIDRRVGNKDFSSIIDSLDDAKDVINWWVKRLSITLERWEQPD